MSKNLGSDLMSFKISRYKNNPQYFITQKMKKLMHLESKLLPDMNRIKTPSDLIRETDRFERYKDNLGISLFRDIICLDFAKIITREVGYELKDVFKMTRAAIDLQMATKLYEEEAIKVKNATIFQLKPVTHREIVYYFIKQIQNGEERLKLPSRFYKK